MRYLILSFLIFSTKLSFAKEQGKIIYSKGIVTAGPAKGPISSVSKNDLVSIGDIIETGEDSLVVIKIDDTVTLKLNEKSKMKIEKPQVAKSKKTYKTFLLKMGSTFVEAMSENLAKKKQGIIVTTKTASFGVRGTKFFVALSHPKGIEFDEEDVWMCVNEGEVVARNKAFGEHVTVAEGEGIAIPFGKNTAPPKKLLGTIKLNWSMDPKWDLENRIPFEQAFYDLLDVDYD